MTHDRLRIPNAAVITDEVRSRKTARLNALQHVVGLEAAGHKLDARVQLVRDQVAHPGVGIVDHYALYARSKRALRRSVDLGRVDLARAPVLPRIARPDFVPVHEGGATFHVRGNENTRLVWARVHSGSVRAAAKCILGSCAIRGRLPRSECTLPCSPSRRVGTTRSWSQMVRWRSEERR